MQLLIGKTLSHAASLHAPTARDAKRILNERCITRLLMSNQLDGRENGLDVIRWLASRNHLPPEIIVIDRNREVCTRMRNILLSHGFRCIDDRHFLKL